MGFINEEGVVISGKDADALKTMFTDVANGFLNELQSRKEWMNPKSFQTLQEDMSAAVHSSLQELEEFMNSPEQKTFDVFYKEQLNNILMGSMKRTEKTTYAYSQVQGWFVESIHNQVSGKVQERDTLQALEKSMSSFSLTKKPFQGIDEIQFDVERNNTTELRLVRKANSTTFLKDDSVTTLQAAYLKGLDVSKEKAIELKKKDKVTPGDLFEAFSTINRQLRGDDERGGMIRSEPISAGGLGEEDLSEESASKNYTIEGIGQLSIPSQLYYTLDKIAGYMNQVKQTENPALRKSRAIQLAAFAYQIAVSEHVFGDANGRSSRLFADTILQTFDLPPHTPNNSMLNIGKTIGESFDFNNGAKLFLDSVKLSNNLLHNTYSKGGKGLEDFLNEEKLNPEYANTMDTQEALYFAVQSRQAKYCIVEAINDFTQANHFFTRNSQQYKDVVKQGQRIKKLLESEPITSEKFKQEMNKLKNQIKEYRMHCKAHQIYNDTRKKRVRSARDIDNAIYAIETTVKQLNKAIERSEEKKPRVEVATKLYEQYISTIAKEEPNAKTDEAKKEFINLVINTDCVTRLVEKPQLIEKNGESLLITALREVKLTVKGDEAKKPKDNEKINDTVNNNVKDSQISMH